MPKIPVLSSPLLATLTLDGRRRTVFVTVGHISGDPLMPCVEVAGVSWPLLSVTDWFGDERRDDLTAANLAELAAELAGEIVEVEVGG